VITHPESPFDGPRLRDRRLELGLSHRAVASEARLPSTTLLLIETGRPRSLTLAQLQLLARALGLHIGELFKPAGAARAPDSNDAEHLGPLLLRNRTLVRVDDVADALGWDLPRVVAAAGDLDTRLRPVGLCVHAPSGRLALRPAGRTRTDGIARLDDATEATKGMSSRSARLLLEAAQGRLQPKHLAHSDLPDYDWLAKRGLLQQTTGATITVTAAVRYGLGDDAG